MQNFNYSMKLRFDVRFVIYFPKLVELDSFKPYLFIFDADLLLVTCQNLASMLIGRVFLSVCYLPKFTFWQVCSLVVFLCLFVTCQNLHFGKYVRWSCLSVCLFVWKFHKRTTHSVNI